MYIDLDPKDPGQREFRRRILAYCVLVDDHWIFTGDLRSGMILRQYKGIQYVVHHTVCDVDGVGEVVCINPAHLVDKELT